MSTITSFLRILLSFLFLGSPLITYSQTLEEDMLQINNVYLNQKSLALSIDYTYYSTFTGGVAEERLTSKCFKVDSNFRVVMPTIESLTYNKYVIVVNKDDKFVVITKRGTNNSTSLIDYSSFFTQYGQLIDSYKVINTPGFRTYTIYGGNLGATPIEKSELKFETSGYRIISIKGFYLTADGQSRDGRLEMYFRYLGDAKASDVDPKRYIVWKGSTPQLSDLYSGYTLVNDLVH